MQINQMVLPSVGASVLTNDKMDVNKVPPIYFLTLVFASFMSMPLFNFRFFFNLFTIFCGTYNVSDPVKGSFVSLKK